MKQWGRRWTALGLCLATILFGALPAAYGGQTVPAAVGETREQLENITAEEKRIITELFALTAEIEALETEIIRLNQEIPLIRQHIEEKQRQIATEALVYDRTRQDMAVVLRARQRSGAASTLEVLLDAADLKDLISRINLLQELARKANQLMKAVEASRDRLESERLALEEMLTTLETARGLLVETRDRQGAVKRQLTDYLESLQSRRAFFQESLSAMEQRWSELKPLFSETVRSFNAIIASGGLPEDTVAMTYSLFSARGRIDADRFNRALAARKDLPRLVFRMKREGVVLDFPDYQIQLTGTFQLADPQSIQYVVTGGVFYGVPLSESALRDLFSQGDLVFRLGTMIGNHTIRQIDLYDGYMELTIGGRP